MKQITSYILDSEGIIMSIIAFMGSLNYPEVLIGLLLSGDLDLIK